MATPQRFLSVIVVPDGARESRTYRISYGRLRVFAGLVLLVAIILGLMVGSWWYLAARAARVAALERRIEAMDDDAQRVAAFALQLEELERQYSRLRLLFGSESTQVASDLWLPPPAGVRPRASSPATSPGPEELPTSWPLTERGFVTQHLLQGPDGNHPGLDIATPTDSYIRAAGPGTVVEVGDDDVYGRYVTLDHGQGYRTLYAHASRTMVERGQIVRRNEVIALSGSTGRSTAPHLHFEILLNGEAVDPLTLVQQP